jgi:hypothetical protein
MRHRDDEYDDEEDDRPRRAKDSRTYYHPRCGGRTQVGGDDYCHICDPYRFSSGTYCCTCEGFVPLREVEWDDTGETITKYRRRMRRETPAPLASWQLGLGAAFGGLLCGGIGLVGCLLANTDGETTATTSILAALGGAAAFHFGGAAILKAVYRIDYRRLE